MVLTHTYRADRLHHPATKVVGKMIFDEAKSYIFGLGEILQSTSVLCLPNKSHGFQPGSLQWTCFKTHTVLSILGIIHIGPLNRLLVCCPAGLGSSFSLVIGMSRSEVSSRTRLIALNLHLVSLSHADRPNEIRSSLTPDDDRDEYSESTTTAAA